jgi:signal transduction histidine kinase
MKTEQIRMLKHELRTPVNHIIGYSELLLEAADDVDDDRTAGQARQLHERGLTLAKLIENGTNPSAGRFDGSSLQMLQGELRPIVDEIMEHCLVTSGIASVDSYEDDLGRIRQAAGRLIALIETWSVTGNSLEPGLGSPCPSASCG